MLTCSNQKKRDALETFTDIYDRALMFYSSSFCCSPSLIGRLSHSRSATPKMRALREALYSSSTNEDVEKAFLIFFKTATFNKDGLSFSHCLIREFISRMKEGPVYSLSPLEIFLSILEDLERTNIANVQNTIFNDIIFSKNNVLLDSMKYIIILRQEQYESQERSLFIFDKLLLWIEQHPKAIQVLGNDFRNPFFCDEIILYDVIIRTIIVNTETSLSILYKLLAFAVAHPAVMTAICYYDNERNLAKAFERAVEWKNYKAIEALLTFSTVHSEAMNAICYYQDSTKQSGLCSAVNVTTWEESESSVEQLFEFASVHSEAMNAICVAGLIDAVKESMKKKVPTLFNRLLAFANNNLQALETIRNNLCHLAYEASLLIWRPRYVVRFNDSLTSASLILETLLDFLTKNTHNSTIPFNVEQMSECITKVYVTGAIVKCCVWRNFIRRLPVYFFLLIVNQIPKNLKLHQ